MASYSTNEFRGGLKIIIDNDPCSIIENEFVKPGKGQAFNRVRIRNLKTGRVVERTFKSGESVEAADIHEQPMQYLYTDGSFWYFMVPDTFEQHGADANTVADALQWLKDGDTCQVTLWNGAPLQVAPPNFVELTIVENGPRVAGRHRPGRRQARDAGDRRRGPGTAVRGAGRGDQGRHAQRRVRFPRQGLAEGTDRKESVRKAHGSGDVIQTRGHGDQAVHANGYAGTVGETVGKGGDQVVVQAWYREPGRAALVLFALESRSLLVRIGKLMIAVCQFHAAGKTLRSAQQPGATWS